eukprot:gene2694-3113_t
MLLEALRIGLGVVMENHVYKFDGRVHWQQRGGAICLELTSNLAQIFMIWWDHTFKSRLSDVGIVTRLCKRYVNDVNMAADEVPAGTRFIEGRLVVDEMATESDSLVPGDRGTMEVIKSIGNSIHPSIQLEIDCPSNHDDGKMPSLDLKLHVRDVGGAKKIVHEFYAKAVSSKAMINAESALPMRQKRTILTQDVLRVLLNCSACIPWEEVAQHVSNMVLRMQFSAFPKKFRYKIVNSALKAYDEIHLRVELEERPLYRPYEWNREERDRGKKNRVLNWYKNEKYDSVIFIQSTLGSELKRKYQSEIDRCGVRIRVVKKAGRSLKSQLQRSDPFKEASCNRETCLICKTGGRGSCSKDGINYEIACVGCEQQGRDMNPVNQAVNGELIAKEFLVA